MKANVAVAVGPSGEPSIDAAYAAARRTACLSGPRRKTLAIAALILLLSGRAFAPILLELPAPQDDPVVWRAVMGYEPSASNPLDRRTVVKPLEEEYQHLIQTRILSLTRPEAARYFGPVLITATNFWDMRASDGGPKPRKHPNDLVLPVFASREIGLSGLHSADPAANKNHTDLHALGELGYLELYYGHDGEHVQAAVLYHRADNHFVPLRSPEDFDGRLKWDQARFALIKKWLDEHLPKVKEEPPKGRERAETPADSTEEREGAAQVSGEGVTNTVAPKEPASVPGSASASAERRTKAKALMKEADSLSREGRIQEASDKMDAALGLKPEVAGERTSDWLRSVDGEINPMPVIQLPGLSAAQQRRRFEDAVRAVAGQHGFTWPQFLEEDRFLVGGGLRAAAIKTALDGEGTHLVLGRVAGCFRGDAGSSRYVGIDPVLLWSQQLGNPGATPLHPARHHPRTGRNGQATPGRIEPLRRRRTWPFLQGERPARERDSDPLPVGRCLQETQGHSPCRGLIATMFFRLP